MTTPHKIRLCPRILLIVCTAILLSLPVVVIVDLLYPQALWENINQKSISSRSYFYFLLAAYLWVAIHTFVKFNYQKQASWGWLAFCFIYLLSFLELLRHLPNT
ncbi:MAG: hypothetical protein ABI443_11135 [Chthoniobacterales bacterium]